MSETHGPSTTFAGDSNPNASKNTMWGASLIAFLIAPVAIVTAILTYLVFSVGKISYKVLLAGTAIYGAVLAVTGLLPKSIELYIASWTSLLSILGADSGDIAGIVGQMLLQQTLLSVLIGGALGSVYSWWRYFRRATWVEMEFRLTPWQWFMKKKHIKDIKNDKNGPADGRTLGINEKGEKIIQSEREAVAHTFVPGASGSGKTTTLLTAARDAIRRGEGFIFVDMKGSTDVPEILASYAKRYGRKFHHWTSHDPRKPYDGPSPSGPAYYDPLGRGNATRRANLLLEGRKWSEDHYRIIIQDYLQKAFEIAEGAPPKQEVDAIADIMSLLDPMALKKRTLSLVGDPYYDEIITEINYLTDKKIDNQVMNSFDSMRRQLGILRDSIQGRWLRRDPEGKNDISLFETAHKGDVVVFTLDSANYTANSALIGNLIIQDLMTVSSELRANPAPDPLNIIIDEFSAIGSDNIINLIARCRDARMPVTLSTQSLGDLKAVSTEFMEQLTGIVSSFIIHRPNRYEDAEVYAGLVGKEKKQVFRQNVEHTTGIFGAIGKGAGTGKGSVEVEEDYKISPAVIQELGPGEMYYICKSPYRIEKVKVIAEEGKVITEEDTPLPVVDPYHPAQTTTFIPDEERDKYRVDPSINGKPRLDNDLPVYGAADFEEEPVKPTFKKSDPERMKAIMGRKSEEAFENEEGSYIDVTQPAEKAPPIEKKAVPALPKLPNVKAAPKLPTPNTVTKPANITKPAGSLPSLPNLSKKPNSPAKLPPLPPKVGKAGMDGLTSLPKVEKPLPPKGARPIVPTNGKSISLPGVFPSPADNEKFKRKQEPSDEPTYGVGDWDDEF